MKYFILINNTYSKQIFNFHYNMYIYLLLFKKGYKKRYVGILTNQDNFVIF